MNWTDRRVITGWSLAALVAIVIALCITSACREDARQKNDRMRQCLATDRTAVDCRLGIYGSV